MSHLEQSQARFSKSEYSAATGPIGHLETVRLKKGTRKRIREHVPDLPGVYAHLDAQQRIIYVGMSTSLCKRLQDYFPSGRRNTHAAKIGRRVHSLLWQPVAHELIAQLRERELIRTLKPPCNRMGKPTKMHLGYLVLTSEDVPRIAIREHLPKSHIGFWGPISIFKTVLRAVDDLTLQFKLRDCPMNTEMHFADESDQIGTACLRAEVKTCLAPCIRGCLRSDYDTEIDQLRQFLNGTSASLLDSIQQDMQHAAVEQQFEKAAALRDRLERLTKLNTQIRRFHDRMYAATYVYPLPSKLEKRTFWMVIVRGHIVAIVGRPRKDGTDPKTSSVLNRAQQHREAESDSLPFRQGDFDAAMILMNWFRRRKKERKRRWSLSRAIRYTAKRSTPPTDAT